MAYNVRVKITCSDPTNTNFQSFENPEAISIIQEFVADGRATVAEEIITSDYRIVEYSYVDYETYEDLRAKLDSLGDYRRSDVFVMKISEYETP